MTISYKTRAESCKESHHESFVDLISSTPLMESPPHIEQSGIFGIPRDLLLFSPGESGRHPLCS
jgi:hypothetical protein